MKITLNGDRDPTEIGVSRIPTLTLTQDNQFCRMFLIVTRMLYRKTELHTYIHVTKYDLFKVKVQLLMN